MIETTEQFEIAVQGRCLCARDLASIREMMRVHPDWTRRRLSLELCELWDWRNEAGRLKDMSCRNLLLKLRDRGLIELPAPTRRPPQSNGGVERRFELDETPLCDPLAELLPLSLKTVHDDLGRRRLFQHLIRRHHYLGYGQHVGENMGYLAETASGRPAACVLFGAAAWKIIGIGTPLSGSPSHTTARTGP